MIQKITIYTPVKQEREVAMHGDLYPDEPVPDELYVCGTCGEEFEAISGHVYNDAPWTYEFHLSRLCKKVRA